MKTLPVGLQLYTVRDFLAVDYAGTLEKVKKMGYDYAELAGLDGKKPEEIKKLADEIGLNMISAHVPYAELIGDTEAVVDAYMSIGVKFIAVPYLDESTRAGSPNFEDVLKNIDKIGAVCHKKGVKLLYHNHDFEFIKMPGGEYGLDYMYSTISAEHLQTEIDTCWVKVAGEDPAAYIRKYAGRCPVVHLKDFKGHKTANMYELIGIAKKADVTEEFGFRPVGSGVQDFPGILMAALESKAEYVIVEQDRSDDCPSLEAAEISRKYLAGLGW